MRILLAIDMSDSWLGHGDVDARAAGAHERYLATHDRLHSPLADIVTDVNERRSSITELQSREASSISRDHRPEHDRLHRLDDGFVFRRVFTGHSIWRGRRRTLCRE